MTTGTFKRNDSSGSRLARYHSHEMVGLVGEPLGITPPCAGGDADSEELAEGRVERRSSE